MAPTSETLRDLVRRYTGAWGGPGPFGTVVPGLVLLRADRPRRAAHRLFKPALCAVLQGAKWTTFGHRRLNYAAGQALVVSLEMLSHGRVVEASPAKPFLGLVIELDLATLREVAESLPRLAPPEDEAGVHSAFVTGFEGPMAECVRKLVGLLDAPEAVAALYPAVMRELCYWLLAGPHGGDIVRLVLGTGHDRRVLAAIQALRSRFAEAVCVEELAQIAHLSATAFHRRFKALTATTPLQYQKRLRLLEARNLLLADTANAETAARQVGYVSASQFSREYARLFGAPPRRDVDRWRRLSCTTAMISGQRDESATVLSGQPGPAVWHKPSFAQGSIVL